VNGFYFIFENDIFCQNFNINLVKIVLKKNEYFKNIFSKTFSKIFKNFFMNISPKVVTKVVQKQAGVAHVIPFTPHLHPNTVVAIWC
jgi:hypothetical protein